MIDTITALQDPCPLPGTETDGDGEVVEGKKIRRHLNDKETLLYAPMSNIGNVIFDKDAMYINLKTVNFSKASDVSQSLVDAKDANGKPMGEVGEGAEKKDANIDSSSAVTGVGMREGGTSRGRERERERAREIEIGHVRERLGMSICQHVLDCLSRGHVLKCEVFIVVSNTFLTLPLTLSLQPFLSLSLSLPLSPPPFLSPSLSLSLPFSLSL